MANKPNNPSLWSKAKSLAKQKFDVYPSAYANGWAAKWYKGKGGTWRKAEYGMEVPYMEDGGIPDNEGFRALPPKVQQQIIDNMAFGGYIPEMAYGGAAQQAAIAIAMKKAGKKPKSMQKGGEPDGSMALGQIDAAIDKLQKLRQFIQPESDLEPWVSSKLTLMDHYTDAVSDYMTYNPEAQEMQGLPMEQMREGGIPQRYRNMGFNKVGVKKNSTRPGKKWMVLAKKGSDYKVVHGGYDGMKDFSQHGSQKRKENFWNRMGGKNSSKATDPFSPLYWHKRFGTWENGGEISEMKAGGSTFSGNAWYQGGGEKKPIITGNPKDPMLRAYRDSLIKYNSGRDIKKFIDSYHNMWGKDPYKMNDYLDYLQMINASNSSNIPIGTENFWGSWGGGSPIISGKYNVYKKPVQPVIYKKSYEDGGFISEYKTGGIHLDPAKKGTFKAQATRMGMSVQEAANAILNAPKGKYSAAMRKKANFAKNFAKEEGGELPQAGNGWIVPAALGALGLGAMMWSNNKRKQIGNAVMPMMTSGIMEDGGLTPGDEIEVTPEELQMLKDGGYTFEII